MSYEKTTWSTGDIVTAEKLNNLENGVSNASPMVVIAEYDEVKDALVVTNAMFDDIATAFSNGATVVFPNIYDGVVSHGTILTLIMDVEFDVVVQFYDINDDQIKCSDRYIFYKRADGTASTDAFSSEG